MNETKIPRGATNLPSTLIAFDSSYRLCAIFRSIAEAASLTGALRQSLIKAAYGTVVSVNKHYWRVVPHDFEIEPDDIGVLSIFDFDAEMGEDRRIYPTKEMARKSSILESEYLELQKSTQKAK